MRPIPFSKIDGGREAFDRAYARGALLAAVKQNRLADHLDSLGAPGAARWDPAKGEVELRGATFRAEQIGSFDGESWLWSWANEHLKLPDARTTCARRLRDTISKREGVAALTTPMIEAADERLPFMMGALALAHSDAEAYYIANQSQVYVMLPGQIPVQPETTLIGEVTRARRSLDGAAGMPRDLLGSLPFAGRALGLSVEESESAIRVSGAGGEIVLERGTAHLAKLALCFLPEPIELDDLLVFFSDDAEDLPFERDADGSSATARGDRWQVRITVETSPVRVGAEAAGLPSRAAEAISSKTLVTVSCSCDESVEGALVPLHGAWVPARLTKDAVGKVASSALLACEGLNELDGAIVYDVMLRQFYP